MTTACTIAAAVILIAGLFAVIVERTNERDDARAESARLTREHDAEMAARDALVAELDQENARLHAELTDLQVGRHLRVVPPRRDGSEHEWPRIARVLEIDVEGGA
jgi:hypothetical protein